MLSREQDEDQKLQLSYFANFENSILNQIVSSKRGLDNFPCPSAGKRETWRRRKSSLRDSHRPLSPPLTRGSAFPSPQPPSWRHCTAAPPSSTFHPSISLPLLSYIYKYKMHEIQIQNTRNANRKETPHPPSTLQFLFRLSMTRKSITARLPLTFCQTRIS